MCPPVTHHRLHWRRFAPQLRFLVLLAGSLCAVGGCSAPDAPEVTFLADGQKITAGPLIYCDVRVEKCERNGADAVSLKVRPGKPVQISVPAEIAKTPWLVNVQHANARGEPQPVRQETFTSGDQSAYTATPPSPEDQLLVVEIQQLGAAFAADERGQPILDQAGNPQLVVRAIWAVQIKP